jgi:hypothetical protein
MEGSRRTASIQAGRHHLTFTLSAFLAIAGIIKANQKNHRCQWHGLPLLVFTPQIIATIRMGNNRNPPNDPILYTKEPERPMVRAKHQKTEKAM